METMEYEVLCINKPPNGTYDQITAIGYQDHDGKVYIISRDEAIRQIEQKESVFYVQAGYHEIPLEIEDKGDHKCLKIPLDNNRKDQLLNLRECKPMKK